MKLWFRSLSFLFKKKIEVMGGLFGEEHDTKNEGLGYLTNPQAWNLEAETMEADGQNSKLQTPTQIRDAAPTNFLIN